MRHPELGGGIRVYVKGAPENILPNCQQQFNEAGKRVRLEGD
jgi:magnesium-transporting ATPase (P-type)